jgi:hypothetical protein
MSKPWESSLQAMDSAIHARVALEIAGSGFIPNLPAQELNLDSPLPFFNDQPFPFLWISGLLMRLLGPDAWSARILSSLFSGGAVCLLYIYMRRFFSGFAALCAAILFLVNPLWIRFSARFQLDPPMIFFILGSFFAWSLYLSDLRKFRFALYAGLSAGFAVCAKSPVGLLIFPAAFINEGLSWKFKRTRVILSLALAALSAFAIISGMWLFANHLSGINLFKDYLERQVFGTAVGGRGMGQGSSILDGIAILGRFCRLEILCLLISALFWFRKATPKQLTRSEHFTLILSGFFVLLLVISNLKFKFPHYFLPGFPLLAAVTGILLSESLGNLESKESRLRTFLSATAPILALALLTIPIKTVPEQFEALKRFIPYMQTHGTKTDSVLFIDHKQPYGSEGDYFCELIFYTRFKFLSSKCNQADLKTRKTSPEWILTSGDQESDLCLSAETLRLYPSRLRFGNQVILSKRASMTSSAEFDLTPGINELRASQYGESIPFRKNMYFTPRVNQE